MLVVYNARIGNTAQEVLLLFLCLLAAQSNAAPEPTADVSSDLDWTITVDPLTFSLGYAHVQVERRFGGHTSVYVGPHLRLFDGLLTEGNEPFLGFGGEVGFRYFPWGRSPRGAWLMGRQVLARLHTTDDSAPAKVGGYSSVLAGYTAVLGGHFVLSGGAGFNYLYYSIGEYGPSGAFPALHTSLGVAF